MHPSQEIKGKKSRLLENKTIVLGVTGSIAAVETIKLARQLIRHGAHVIPVMTPAATRIIHPDALWFATGEKPVVDLTGKTEHVYYCGDVADHADLLLISPCTANTLSKIAHSIDDTAVTTFATTAIGARHPIIIVPAMHKSMYDHPIVQENISTLKKHGISFVDPFLTQKKAKMASIEEICASVIRHLSSNILTKKHLLIIGGSCYEPIDDVRGICNQSSGKTALALATHGYYQGATVDLWYGTSPQPPPSFLTIASFQTLQDITQLVNSTEIKRYDIICVCAALSDYIPTKVSGKISSDQHNVSISLKRAEKLLGLLRKKAPHSQLIGFKLETTEKTAMKKAKALLNTHNLDAVIANTTSTIDADQTKSWMITKGNILPVHGTKDDWAQTVISHLGTM